MGPRRNLQELAARFPVLKIRFPHLATPLPAADPGSRITRNNSPSPECSGWGEAGPKRRGPPGKLRNELGRTLPGCVPLPRPGTSPGPPAGVGSREQGAAGRAGRPRGSASPGPLVLRSSAVLARPHRTPRSPDLWGRARSPGAPAGGRAPSEGGGARARTRGERAGWTGEQSGRGERGAPAEPAAHLPPRRSPAGERARPAPSGPLPSGAAASRRRGHRRRHVMRVARAPRKHQRSAPLPGLGAPSLLAITVDRYLSLYYALTYHSERTVTFTYAMLVVLWGTSICLGLLPVLGWNCLRDESTCSVVRPLTKNNAAILSVSFLFMFALMLQLYVQICKIVMRHAHQIALQHHFLATSHYVTTRKGVSTLAIILGTFAACWMPFTLYSLIADYTYPSIYTYATLLPATYNSIINPVIYAFRNQEIQKALCLVCCGCIPSALSQRARSPSDV
ncbi:G-protein coupled receptor 12 isoform X2 [Oryctolagus cuniculus]|uniref:G-protein coupled receptor 12 isoform X2 n=1 Tax=Oryctolagus cuniculus TaxID=9986 RepID=UPI00387A0C08